MAFEVGQKVKCINAGRIGAFHAQKNLTVGKVYDVLTYDAKGYVKIAQDDGRECVKAAERFELYVEEAQAIIQEMPEPAPGVKIVCVEGLREAGLRVGKVCTIKTVGVHVYYTEEFPGKGFAKRRFTIQLVNKLVDKQRELVAGDIVYITSAPKSSYDGWDKHLVNNGKEYKIKELVCKVAQPKHNDLSFVIPHGDDKYGGFYVPRAALSLKKAAAPRFFKVGDKVMIGKLPPLNADNYYENTYWNGDMRSRVKSKKILTIADIREYGPLKGNLKMVEDGFLYNPDCVVFADTGLPEGVGAITANAPVQPPKPKELTLEEHMVEMRKKVAPGSGAICSFGYKEKEKKPVYEMTPACYAPANYITGEVEAFIISLQNGRKYNSNIDEELLKKWNEYVLYRSPFSDSFVKADYQDNYDNGIVMDVNKTIHQILASAIAIRVGHEYSAQLPVFAHFIEQGYGENTAFLMSHLVCWDKKKFTEAGFGASGHGVLIGAMNYKELIKFFQQGYHIDLGKPVNQEKPGRYQIFNCIAKQAGDSIKEHFQSSIKKEKKGDGWAAVVQVTEESVYNYAEQLNKLIN